ncbi:MAG: SIMPL domain-containing protein [Alphaproteobacteria bacterium]
MSGSGTMFRAGALLALVAAISLSVAGSAPKAQAADEAWKLRTLVVTGEGKVMAKPDQAQLSAGVITEAKTAAAALSANNKAMNKVFATLKSLGIPENKIQTSNFSVSPQFPPYKPDNPEPRRIIGYQVSNQVTVIVDDLSKLGSALDALVKSGVNQLNGVSFTFAKPEGLQERARRAAVAQAIAKAKGMAQAAGVRLGPIHNIQEGGAVVPLPQPMMMRAMAAESVPIATGESTISASVTLTYIIQ